MQDYLNKQFKDLKAPIFTMQQEPLERILSQGSSSTDMNTKRKA